jgi:outer membrane protein TolC
MLDDEIADLYALNQKIKRTTQISIPLAIQKESLQLASYQAGKAKLTDVIATRQALLEQRMHLIDLQQQLSIITAQLYFNFVEPTRNHTEE